MRDEQKYILLIAVALIIILSIFVYEFSTQAGCANPCEKCQLQTGKTCINYNKIEENLPKNFSENPSTIKSIP